MKQTLSQRIRPTVEAAPWVVDEVRALEAELAALQDLVQRYHGIDRPFICGHVEGSGLGTLPEQIVVCPAMGSDVIAVYQRVTPASGPKY